MRPWIARAIMVCASCLFGVFVAMAGDYRTGLHLIPLLSPRSLATMRTLGWLSRAARNHGNETEIP